MKKLFSGLVLAGLTFNPLTGFTATGLIDLSLLRSDEDSSKFGEYSDYADSGGKVIGAFELSGTTPWSTGSGQWQMEGKNLGLDSYDFSYTLTEPSRYTIRLTFDGSQQYSQIDSSTPFFAGSDNTLRLPDSWVAAPTSAGMTAFNVTARTFDEEVQRDSIDLEINLQLGKQWQFDATYQSLNRQGTKLAGGAIYFDASTAFASLLPIEIDEDSKSYSVSLTYASDRLINTVSYLVSSFNDRNDQLTWMNPFLIPDNTTISYTTGAGSLSLSPDNDRQALRITGSHHPEMIKGFSVQWDTAWSETEQAGSLLPYTTNAALRITEPLPIDGLDTRLDSFNGSLRLSYRPSGKLFRRLLLRSSYSVDDRNYDKDRTVFNYIRGDGADQPESILGVYANAHDFRKERSSVAADYRLPLWRSKVTLEFEKAEVERQNAAVSETDTETVRGILRLTPFENTGVRIESAISDSSSATYQWNQSFLASRTSAFIDQTPVDQRFNNHPLLSQFHLANAETDDLKINVSYTGLSRWSFGLDLQRQDVDYDKTVLGLIDAETRYYGIDIQYLASAQLTSYAMASWAYYETNTAGRSFGGGIEKPADRVVAPLPQGSDPRRNWMTRIQDEVFTFSTGLTWQNLDKLSADASYTLVRTESGFLAETGGSTNLDASELPDLDTELHSINLSISYQFNDKTGMTAIYQYFDFEESDWATRGVAFDSVPNLLGTGQSSLSSEVNLIGISIQHRF